MRRAKMDASLPTLDVATCTAPSICPKGQCLNNTREKDTIDKLHQLIDLPSIMRSVHTFEFRAADVLYSEPAQSDQLFAACQVKTSRLASNRNCFTFHLNAADMLSILQKNMSLLAIGIDQDDAIIVAWFFHSPSDDGEITSKLTEFADKAFTPVYQLKMATRSPFAKWYNHPTYRFDLDPKLPKSAAERARLLERIGKGVRAEPFKKTIDFFNDDESQIPGSGHLAQHRVLLATRALFSPERCAHIGLPHIKFEKDLGDSYTRVNCRVRCDSPPFANMDVRVKDNVTTTTLSLRRDKKYPMDPDSIDVMQFTERSPPPDGETYVNHTIKAHQLTGLQIRHSDASGHIDGGWNRHGDIDLLQEAADEHGHHPVRRRMEASTCSCRIHA